MIRKEIGKQLLYVFYLFCLGSFLGQGFKFNPETSITFLYFFGLPLFVSLIGFLASGRIVRVFVYQLFICLVGIGSSIFMLVAMYSYVVVTSSTTAPGINIGINILTIISMIIISVRAERVNFSEAERVNIKTGKIDLRNGTWDLQKKIYWDNPEKEQLREKTSLRIKRFSILIPGISFLFVRIVHPSLDMIKIFSLLFFAYLLAYGSGRNINLLFQILRWEKEIGGPIKLK